MQGSEPPGDRRAALYVRSLMPDGYHRQQRELLDRAEALVEDGTLAAQSVRVWGDQAPATRAGAHTERGERVLDRVEAFREWAVTNGLSLAPAFETRAVDDSITGAGYRAVRFPAVTLAEFRGDAVVCVTPHADGDAVTTVSDRLAALESGDYREYTSYDMAAPAETGEEREAAADLERTPGVVDRDHGPVPSE